jgi:hypothetical protein
MIVAESVDSSGEGQFGAYATLHNRLRGVSVTEGLPYCHCLHGKVLYAINLVRITCMLRFCGQYYVVFTQAFVCMALLNNYVNVPFVVLSIYG